MRICGYTRGCLDSQTVLAGEALRSAEAVVIGAGAGLSASAGFTYDGERFEKNFPDFIRKYGFKDMYSAGFYPFETPEEFWGYWSRYILINRYGDSDNGTYKRLFELVRDKDYFVLTTNVDHCFQKAGFDKERLFYTQGDYGLFQCSVPCHRKTYDNEGVIREMVKRQSGMKIPSELIPRCPVCGKPMTVNLRSDDRFAEDEGWQAASRRYSGFLRSHMGSRVLFLELGVGMNTPGIIKFPFWKMTREFHEAMYVSINFGEAFAPSDISDRAVCIQSDIRSALFKM